MASPGEYPLWIEMRAAELGMPRAPLERAVKDIIAAKEKARREQKADDARQQREQTRKKEKEFKRVAELPERDREARLEGLAESLGEDPVAMREEFAAAAGPPATEVIEPWPEAVETAALLEELIAQLQRFVVFKYDTDPAAAALWIAFAWVHDIAIHSPILAVMAPDINCGKSTMLGALKYLTPRPFAGVELTGPSLSIATARPCSSTKPATCFIASAIFRTSSTQADLRHHDPARRTGRRPRLRSVQPESDCLQRYDAALRHGEPMHCHHAMASCPARRPSCSRTPTPEFRVAAQAGALERRPCDGACRSESGVASDFDNRAAANWRLLFAIADHAGGDGPAGGTPPYRAPSEPSAAGRLLEAMRGLRNQGGNKESIATAAVVGRSPPTFDSEWCECAAGARLPNGRLPRC
jgi:hypothetical protein